MSPPDAERPEAAGLGSSEEQSAGRLDKAQDTSRDGFVLVARSLRAAYLALKRAPKLGAFDRRVFDAVVCTVGLYSRLEDDTVTVAQLAAWVYDVVPDAVCGRHRSKVQESLTRLSHAGVIVYEAQRGRPRAGSFARERTVKLGVPAAETLPNPGVDSEQWTPVSDRKAPRPGTEKHPIRGGTPSRFTEQVSEKNQQPRDDDFCEFCADREPGTVCNVCWMTKPAPDIAQQLAETVGKPLRSCKAAVARLRKLGATDDDFTFALDEATENDAHAIAYVRVIVERRVAERRAQEKAEKDEQRRAGCPRCEGQGVYVTDDGFARQCKHEDVGAGVAA